MVGTLSLPRSSLWNPHTAAVGAGVFYLLESPTSPVPYATSRETPHEAGPIKGVLQGIPDIFWPENKNPFVEPRPAEGVPGDYYKEKVCVLVCSLVCFCVWTNKNTWIETKNHLKL